MGCEAQFFCEVGSWQKCTLVSCLGDSSDPRPRGTHMILHLVPATAERSGFAPQCSSRRCFMNFKLLHSWTQLASVGLSWTQLDPRRISSPCSIRCRRGHPNEVGRFLGGGCASLSDVKADGVKPNSSCYRTIMHGNLATKFHTGLAD